MKTDSPQVFSQHKEATRFLHVPVGDWPAVKIGRKTEFRIPVGKSKHPHFAYTPTPVLAYTRRGETYDWRLMVLTGIREETLIQISEDPGSLAREGFHSYPEFRLYWRERFNEYLPLTQVLVYCVREWEPEEDDRAMGAVIVHHLYGDFK